MELSKKEFDILYNKQKAMFIGNIMQDMGHAIMNPLTGIISYSEILKNTKNNTEKHNKIATKINDAANKINRIVKSIQYFSSTSCNIFESKSIEKILQDSLDLFEVRLSEANIVPNCNISEDIPKIECWSQQVQAAFVVLIQNAIESLFLKHGSVDLEHDQQLNITLTSDLTHIIIEFYDNGIGIDKKHFEDIYCENFTSKERKTDTLNLYTVNKIIGNHEGSIEIDSKKGEWAKFTIKFAL